MNFPPLCVLEPSVNAKGRRNKNNKLTTKYRFQLSLIGPTEHKPSDGEY